MLVQELPQLDNSGRRRWKLRRCTRGAVALPTPGSRVAGGQQRQGRALPLDVASPPSLPPPPVLPPALRGASAAALGPAAAATVPAATLTAAVVVEAGVRT